LRRKSARIVASEETAALAGHRGKVFSALDEEGTRLELVPSGHMLGASQLRAERGGESFTFTGDFKLGRSLTCPPAEVLETDTLVIEGTFGAPGCEFPDREEVYSEIAAFVSENHSRGHIVLLGGYALGKAQELVAVVNRYCGLVPVVSEKIARACGVYSSFGVRLEAAEAGTPEADELMKGGFVAVMPFHQVGFELAVRLSREYRRSVYTAVATGWAASARFPTDAAFPLSDHADFGDILRYVEEARPKKVYCCHGNEEVLSRELRRRGINAFGLGGKSAQATMLGW
jgi:putative mRNA 3-end processing factor